MQKYFVPYEIALALKEIGFDEPCYAYYGLGLEKDEFKQLQFHIDYGTSYYHIPIEDNFFAKTKRNSDMGHAPTAPIYDQVIDWFIEKHDLCISVPNVEYGWYKILGRRVDINKKTDPEYGYDKKAERHLILNTAILKAIELIK